MENKVIHVKAFFKKTESEGNHSVYKNLDKSAQFDDPWTNKKITVAELPKTIQHSDCEVDSERLARDLDLALTELSNTGFVLKEIIPITSGKYHFEVYSSFLGKDAHPYGYGYSYTDSVIVVGQK
jgi:hypothetical protein